MLCKQGKVFLADLEKNSKDNPYNVRGKRPVMIISQIGKEFVEVIPISSKVREGRSNKYSIRVLLQGE